MSPKPVSMTAEAEKTLEFYGGKAGALTPFAVLISGIGVLAYNNQAGTTQFWVCGFLALVTGLFFSKDKHRYCDSLMHGIADRNGIIVVTAWIFAAILGKTMVSAGLIDGILWLGMSSGVGGSLFAVVAFLASALFAVGTGTSNGTTIALSPVLFPAGVLLGADPTLVALAIISGGAFGDNVAPISDTTIVSAYTQGATLNDVVRSRLPLACTAAACTIIYLFFFGGAGTSSSAPAAVNTSPKSVLLLIALGVVVASALKRQHILASLTYGIVTAAVIGIAIGTISIDTFFHVPAQRGDSTGIIQDGIGSVVGAIIFVIFVMAAVRIFTESGLMDSMLQFFRTHIAKSLIQAELSIFGVSILAASTITSNTPALLLVGPTLVKPLGEKFQLAKARCANLMDCGVCSVFYLLPWAIPILVWHSIIGAAAADLGIETPAIASSLTSPYPLALFMVMTFSIFTGWNRKFINS